MARTLPNLGLAAFFALGEDGWDDEMSLNLLKLSVLTQGNVISTVSATPGAPADGDVHIFDGTHPTQANKVAIRDDGAWIYLTPVEGWMLYDKTANQFMKFDGAAWAPFTVSGVQKYRIGFSIEVSAPTASEVLLRHVLQHNVTFADDFAGSFGRLRPAGANPATAQTFTIYLNAAAVGTMSISTGGVVTFATTGGAVVGTAGDEIRVDAPAAPDANLVGVSVTLYGLEA